MLGLRPAERPRRVPYTPSSIDPRDLPSVLTVAGPMDDPARSAGQSSTCPLRRRPTLSSGPGVSRCTPCARDNPAGSRFCNACGRPVNPHGDPAAGPGTRPDDVLDLASEVPRLAEPVDRQDTILA